MKIKLLIQVVMVSCLGIGSSSYGQPVIYCAALRMSQAYEKGTITEDRLERLYYLWKDDLNAFFSTEDPIATYEDFKMIFALGKKRIQVACPFDNEANCNEQLQQIAESTGNPPKIAKQIANTDNQLLTFVLENTEPLSIGFRWYMLNYQCEDDLEDIINACSLALLSKKEKKDL